MAAEWIVLLSGLQKGFYLIMLNSLPLDSCTACEAGVPGDPPGWPSSLARCHDLPCQLLPAGLARTPRWFDCGCGTCQSWHSLHCLLFSVFPSSACVAAAVPADLARVRGGSAGGRPLPPGRSSQQARGWGSRRQPGPCRFPRPRHPDQEASRWGFPLLRRHPDGVRDGVGVCAPA